MPQDNESVLLGYVVILEFFYMYYLAIFQRKPIPIIFCSIFTPVVIAAYSRSNVVMDASVVLALALGVFYMIRAASKRKISHFVASLFFVLIVFFALGAGGFLGANTLLIPLTLLAMLWYGATAMWKGLKAGYQDLISG
jgi:hypothetical protein